MGESRDSTVLLAEPVPRRISADLSQPDNHITVDLTKRLDVLIAQSIENESKSQILLEQASRDDKIFKGLFILVGIIILSILGWSLKSLFINIKERKEAATRQKRLSSNRTSQED